MSLQQHLITHLQHMYVNERDYQAYLREWSGQVHDQQLKESVNEQIQGIDQELNNLKQCLSSFNASPQEDMKSPVVDALRQDDQMTRQHMPNATRVDLDVHLAMTDVMFGNAEIGSYQGMLTMARVLKKPEVIHMLEQTLQHEEDDLQTMQGLLNDLIDISDQQQRAA